MRSFGERRLDEPEKHVSRLAAQRAYEIAGIGQLHELVTQLRGEAGARQVQSARHAIQENGGSLPGIEEASVAIHMLGR